MPDASLVNFEEPYALSPAIAANQQSAIKLILQLLGLKGVTEQHLKEQLSIGLWKWTEAAGMAPHSKFNLRYVSDGARRPQGPTRINHEHVWPRKWLIQRLRARSWSEEELRGFLEAYGVACVVTVAEHGLLGATDAVGWDRYVAAGVRVLDRLTGKQAELPTISGSSPVRRIPAEEPSVQSSDLGAEPTAEPTTARSGTHRQRTAADLDLDAVIADRTKASFAPYVRQLIRTSRFALAVPVPAIRIDGAVSDYFRIHDAFVGEPTPTVAFVHWTGRIAYRLRPEDLPPDVQANELVQTLANGQYRLQVRVADDSSLELAEDLLFIALDRLRAQFLP